jgi:hypothetical protein
MQGPNVCRDIPIGIHLDILYDRTLASRHGQASFTQSKLKEFGIPLRTKFCILLKDQDACW